MIKKRFEDEIIIRYVIEHKQQNDERVEEELSHGKSKDTCVGVENRKQ